MSEYTFTDALGYSMSQLAEICNASFREFYFAVQDTPLDMSLYCLRNNIDFANTVVMWQGDNAIGLSLTATRGRRGWIGAFGIVPEYRGQGAGKAMLKRQFEVARAAGLTQIKLEVLAQNTRARRLYEGSGFKVTREVLNLKIAATAIEPHPFSAPISAIEPELIIDWLMQGQQPAWSRERTSLLITATDALVLNDPGEPTAAMLYRRYKNDRELEISAVALTGRDRVNDFLALLHYAAAGVENISILDEPDDMVLYQICKELGFGEEDRQYEMVAEL